MKFGNYIWFIFKKYTILRKFEIEFVLLFKRRLQNWNISERLIFSNLWYKKDWIDVKFILHTSKVWRWSLVNKIPSFYYRLYMHDIQLCMNAINVVRILYNHSRFCYEISRHDFDVYYQCNYFLSDSRFRFLTILKRLNSIVSTNILHFKAL